MLNVVFKKNKKRIRFYEVSPNKFWVMQTDKNRDVWLVETLYFDGKGQSQKQFILNHAKKYGLLEKHIDPLYPNQQHFKI